MTQAMPGEGGRGGPGGGAGSGGVQLEYSDLKNSPSFERARIAAQSVRRGAGGGARKLVSMSSRSRLIPARALFKDTSARLLVGAPTTS